MFELHGRVAVVTGAGRGIGRATALALHGRGARLALLDVDAAGVAATADLLSPTAAIALNVDIADSAALAAARDQIVDHWGRLDIWVNNAAIVDTTPLQSLTPAAWERVMAVDLQSVLVAIQLAADPMIASGGGRIINLASVAAKVGGGYFGTAAYAAAKAGVIALTKAAARELAVQKITVNAIAPGGIDTPLTADIPPEIRRKVIAGIPLGRFGRPEEVAAAVVFLASDEAAYITGEILDINGGLLMD